MVLGLREESMVSRIGVLGSLAACLLIGSCSPVSPLGPVASSQGSPVPSSVDIPPEPSGGWPADPFTPCENLAEQVTSRWYQKWHSPSTRDVANRTQTQGMLVSMANQMDALTAEHPEYLATTWPAFAQRLRTYARAISTPMTQADFEAVAAEMQNYIVGSLFEARRGSDTLDGACWAIADWVKQNVKR